MKKKIVIALILFVLAVSGFCLFSYLLIPDNALTGKPGERTELERNMEKKLLNQEELTDKEKSAYKELIKRRKETP